jgi:diguanylate cyclase (GGDEF)-like protein/PAS domain S-box-containing protein
MDVIALDLIDNLAVLLSLVVVYILVPDKAQHKFKKTQQIITGLAIGAIGFIVMSNPFQAVPGVVFDTRSILISVSGLFFGMVPTAIASSAMIAARIIHGGAGMATGILFILFSAAAGLVWRRFRFKKLESGKNFRWLELLLLGLVTHVGVWLLTLTLPSPDIPYILSRVTFSVLAVFPAGTMVLGLLLFIQMDRRKAQISLEEGERRYTSIFEDNKAVMILLEPVTWKIYDVNQAAASFYGWPREVMRTMSFSDIDVLPREEILKRLENVLSGKENSFELPHRLASGEVRDVAFFVGRINLQGKDIIYSIVQDVTEKNRALETLKESEERFRTIFRSNQAAMIVSDPVTMDITDANEAAVRFFGWSQEKLRSLNVMDIGIMPKEEVSRKTENILNGEKDSLEMPIRLATGDIRDISVFPGKIKVLGKEYIFSIIQDITEKNRALKTLKVSEERYKSIFEENNAVMLLTDPGTWDIIDVNAAAERFYGYPREAMRTMNVGDLDVLTHEEIVKRLEKVLAGRDTHFEIPQRLATGEIRDVAIYTGRVHTGETHMVCSIVQDVTERNRALERLSESEERYRVFFEKIQAVMLVSDPDNWNILDANDAAASYYGWPREKLCTMNLYDICPMSMAEIVKEIESTVYSNKNRMELRHRLASGEIRDVEVFSGHAVRQRGQELVYQIIQDVTERNRALEKLKESEERLGVTLLSVGDGVITTDCGGMITMINKAAEKITGWTNQTAAGLPASSVLNIVSEYPGVKAEDPVQKVLDTGEPVALANHTVLICKNGKKKPIADSAAPILDKDGNILGAVLVIRDVSGEMKKQEQILYLGYHDGMTGLYNRGFFDEEVKRLNTERNHPISVIIGDVNGLKLTNDAFGHAAGDLLLKEMSRCIKSACRPKDIVARWGGDEFVVLLCRTDMKRAEEVCRRIKENCAKVDLGFVDFSISLGCETKYNPEEDIHRTINAAEDYMYRKKSIESANMRGNTINTIMHALHEKSPREREHSNRVSDLCKEIGTMLNLSDKEITELGLIGLMHDIGKIGISEAILNKEKKLTQAEWTEIKRHPEISYRILSASVNMAYIAEYVLCHHERLDGSGYPNGISGDAITLQTRILAVADAFDAMTSGRPYKTALSREEAFNELDRCAGTQFDPAVIDALRRYFEMQENIPAANI